MGMKCVCVHVCVFMFIPSPIRVGTHLMEVPGTPIWASFFHFELKPTGRNSADPTQISAPYSIGKEESISKHSQEKVESIE